jgi:hypothetical protein
VRGYSQPTVAVLGGAGKRGCLSLAGSNAASSSTTNRIVCASLCGPIPGW